MKKITLFAASALLLLTSAFTTIPKDDFEGSIIYDIQFEPSVSLPAEALPMFEGSQMKIYKKGDKTRTEMSTGPYVTTIISDKKTNLTIQLIDAMGKKMMTKGNLDSLNKVQEAEAIAPEITYLNDTREIAGYKCKNAKIVSKDKSGEEVSYIAWYTEDLSFDGSNGKIKGLKGFPLEYMMSRGGVKFSLTAKNISKEKVEDSTFDIPTGYAEMSPDQMKKMMSRGQ